MTRRLNLTATLTTTGAVTPPIGPVPSDTAAALWSAIDAYGCDAASHGALGKDATTRAAIDRTITAHVEAEVARRLAAAPDVEAAIRAYDAAAQAEGAALALHRLPTGGDETYAAYTRAFKASEDAWSNLERAIAADKARAVEATEDAAFIRGRDAVRKCPDGWGLIARPTPDEARRLVDDAMQAAWGLNRPSGQSPDRREAARERATAARTALLRALGVEA